MYSTTRWSKDVILVLISGIYLKQLFSHSYLITWLNNLIIVIIMIVEKNIYKRGGFFFAERNNRCRTKLINNYEMHQIILLTHKCNIK